MEFKIVKETKWFNNELITYVVALFYHASSMILWVCYPTHLSCKSLPRYSIISTYLSRCLQYVYFCAIFEIKICKILFLKPTRGHYLKGYFQKMSYGGPCPQTPLVLLGQEKY